MPQPDAPNTPPYQSNLHVDQAAHWLLDGRRVFVTAHAKPDPDALGSILALARRLQLAGRDVLPAVMPPVLASLRRLPRAEQVLTLNPDRLPDLSGFDRLVVLDTGASVQLNALAPALTPHADRLLIVDHHLSGDLPAAHRLIDSRAAACCELLIDLLDAVDARLDTPDASLRDDAIRDALFAGLAADTGWFRFSSTTARTHRLAARLLDAGLDQARLYRDLEQAERPEKLALLQRAVASLELLAHARVALMILRPEDFTETGAMPEETDRFVDLPQAAATVRLVCLAAQPDPDGPVRLSLRSKPGDDAVNVAELAASLGGGGHARAAGARMAGPLATTLPTLRQLLADAVTR